MSIISKIMFKGWTKPDGFPRERIARELDSPEENRHITGKAKFKCKRNKGDHDLILIPPNGKADWTKGRNQAQYLANLFQPKPDFTSYMPLGADVYQCRACGHIEYEFRK